MSNPDGPDDLRSLGERLDKVRRGRGGGAPGGDGGRDGGFNTALGFGMRIGLELVVAVALGLGIGWAIDQGLGSKPIAMIIGMFLGFAAGILNVYRAMKGLGMAIGYQQPTPPPRTDEDEEE
jgi:ATP synthase protein I